MQKPITLLLIATSFLYITSCKNETKNQENKNTDEIFSETQVLKRAPKKNLTSEEIAVVQSVMTRIMRDDDLKKFASYLVSAKLGTLLSSEKGPFLVIAPSSTVLESLPPEKKKFYASTENKPKLEEFLKSHIAEKTSHETFIQTLNESNKASIKTMTGKTLIATKKGEHIFITDESGKKVKVIKPQISGSNGIVYVVDGVLNID